MLPLYPDNRSLRDLLGEMFSKHPWHFRLMTSQDGFEGVPFLYLASSFTLEAYLRSIKEETKRISFHGIEVPKPFLSRHLHFLRRQLSRLRDCIDETRDFKPASVEHYLQQRIQVGPTSLLNSDRYRRGIDARLEILQTEAKALHEFIMETFNILSTTIALLESRENARQTRQSSLLTILAAVYLPLSLATGIFGMNIHEINDGHPRFWAFLATTGGLAVITVSIISFMLGFAKGESEIRGQA
jgi:Mg2+ and Co2+ transporter CorA